MTQGQPLPFTETLYLAYKMGTVARSSGTPVAGAGSASSVPGPGDSPVNRGPGPGRGGAGGACRRQALTAPWVQPARRGPSGLAARRSAGASSGTRRRVTGGMAAVPARRASGGSDARTVSAAGLGAGVSLGRLTLQTPFSSPPAACEPGFFGPGCRQACACPPGSACDPVSGECGKQCPAGYRGRHCDQGEQLIPGARGAGGVRAVQPELGAGPQKCSELEAEPALRPGLGGASTRCGAIWSPSPCACGSCLGRSWRDWPGPAREGSVPLQRRHSPPRPFTPPRAGRASC